MPPALEYETMKNSGIEWIGAVPSHWNIRTLYQLVSQVKNKNSDLAEQNLLSLSYGKIKRKDINSTDGLLPASFDGYNIIEAGDIVLRLTDLQNDHTSLRVGLATERGIITSAYITLHPFDIKHSKYLYYLLHTFDIKKGFYGMGSGVRQGLNYGEVKELRIALPLQNELGTIASYLDMKCAEIDEVILETKASIGEYKLWKSSVIFEAITKGLDPTVEMKDSGVEWIGKVPAHWELKKFKHFTIGSNTGEAISKEYWDETGGRLLYTAGQNPVRSNYKKFPSYWLTTDNDLLVARNGAGAIHIPVKNSIYTDHVIRFILSSEGNRTFLYYSLLVGMEKVVSEAIDVSLKTLSKSSWNKVPIPTPPLPEQQCIADHLDKECSEMDKIIVEKELLIRELEEYKQSLIYEVVTGKRKVV